MKFSTSILSLQNFVGPFILKKNLLKILQIIIKFTSEDTYAILVSMKLVYISYFIS